MSQNGLAKKFAKRILELRREQKWSQPELGKKIGTSGTIIGRYERGEMTPSVLVARKIADAFGVSLDYLFEHDSQLEMLNTDMLQRLQSLGGLSGQEREWILSVMDALLRDARARETYSTKN